MKARVLACQQRVSRMDPATLVSQFMTPYEKLITAPEGTSLKEANDIIWDHKLNLKARVLACQQEYPSEESMHSTSAPASTRAGTRCS